MKVVKVERLIDAGQFSSSANWRKIENDITLAIAEVQWPPHSGSFTIYPQSAKKRGEGNGVKPIKAACMIHLKSLGWGLETRLDIATVRTPGPLDATLPVGSRYFAVEWETGNVSSSHRALNKMILGMQRRQLIGGALIVPTADLYRYLTDRIGTFPELEPYFALWRSCPVEEGLLVVIAIEQDGVSTAVPKIPTGTDGRALA